MGCLPRNLNENSCLPNIPTLESWCLYAVPNPNQSLCPRESTTLISPNWINQGGKDHPHQSTGLNRGRLRECSSEKNQNVLPKEKVSVSRENNG